MSSDRLSATPIQIQIGVSPLSWVNEVLDELGAGTSADQVLNEAKAAGFAGVEMSKVFPSNPDELLALLDHHDLKFISGWYSGFLAERDVEEELEAVAAHADMLKHCGAAVMVYGECGHMTQDALDVPMTERLTLSPSDMSEYGQRLTEFSRQLKARYGLDLAYHHHLMMVAETLDEVRAVMDASGEEVGLLLDTGHAFAGGFEYSELIRLYSPRIKHVHLKDVRSNILAKVRSEGMSFNEGVVAGMFTVPGDGSVDFEPILKFLTSGLYSGWVVVEAEQDPKIALPAETVSRARKYVLSRMLFSSAE